MPNTKYLKEITDSFGVWQHSVNGEVLRSEGYALDDAARALIVFIIYKDLEQAEVCFKYLEASYFNKKFYGFFDENKKPIAKTFPSSEDAFNLGVMALAYCISVNFNTERAKSLLGKLKLDHSKYTRSVSYRLIAECYLNNSKIVEKYAMDLFGKFSNENNWFEEYLTYANALMPLSLLMFLNTFTLYKEILEPIILESINTVEHNMRIGVIPSPLGNSIQHRVGSKVRDVYGQQPIEAAFMVLMYKQAYKYFKDEIYLQRAVEWMDWFTGENIWKKSLVKDECACADGLDDKDISQNYGAESTIMYLWAASID